ncbi:bifunctional metallophosphatase/5'-nucleotidase [Megamonas funiformis]|uniref:bifunctional metallophosphatase/5'-nucleotidase n=1 Tax=Megamonas funiformis TaxID=437897 RepID=UPI0019563573|nr:bifunctional UDP-sugar hydrolase/5'-nucleotidase [Megamonas funiformis]MBM6651612.1 bifunctional metallophosphatase/5'-nucleotidase [Megamonas funiformis]
MHIYPLKIHQLFLALLTFCFIFIPNSAWAIQKDIIILYTNDVHCGIEDNLGYTKLAQYKEDLQQDTPYITLVDAGDAIQGAPIGKLSTGEAIINIMNEIGYDFAIPGNHEFDYGMDRFLILNDKLSCGYYSSNLVNTITGKNLLPAYKIFQFDDKKIALIGVTTPETLNSSTPAYFQDDKGIFIYSFNEDATGKKLYTNIQNTVDTVKKLGVDYVFLVAHLGMSGITPRWSSLAVAQNTQGIDAIIDGHSHEVIPSFIAKNKQGKNVLITQTGTKLQNIGKLTITPQGKISTELINDLTKTNQKTTDLINEEKNKYAPLLNQIIGKNTVKLITNDPNTNTRLVRNSETNLGDFVTDAYRVVLNTDVAICNGGAIRNELPIGDFSYNDILTTFPFGNMCVVLEITGQQLLDALEMGASRYPEEFGGFMQISGATYTINSKIPSFVITDEKGNFIKVDGAYRVQDVKINGKDLDLNKKYTIGGTSYILKFAGNGMTMFKDSPILQNEELSETDVIIEYIQNYLNATIGNEYANPYGQNRITIIK